MTTITPAMPLRRSVGDDTSAGLWGAPASSGTVTGRARIVRGPLDAAKLRRGEILVCVTLTPEWTPLLSLAAGVIAEAGGTLSNSATIARERRIPAVVAVRDATSRIRNGQLVTIDGDAGAVTLGS
jgi:pyruvate,water dikinase